MAGRRDARLVVGALCFAALACLWVATAAASTTTAGGITYVTKERKAKSNQYTQLVVKCPAGTHVLGGGEDSNAPYTQLELRHTFPVDGKDRDSKPDDGWAVGVGASIQDRDVSVTAICAKLQPDYRRKSFTAFGSQQSGEYDVNCRGDDRVLSGGTKGASVLSENSGFPPSGDAWGFYIDNQAPTDTSVKGYAVCADINTKIVELDDTAPPNDADAQQASCPQHKHVVGGGQANGAGYGDMVANRMTPVTDSGWLASVNNYDGMTAFSYVVYAVCVGSL